MRYFETVNKQILLGKSWKVFSLKMWENWIWFVKQNRHYTVVQSRVHFVCEGILHDMKKDIYQVLFFFISSGFDASITLFCWKRAKIYEIFWLIRKPIPWIFFRFFSYVVIKMSENFNKFQENITRKARVNFHCKCYKLIKCKPSL